MIRFENVTKVYARGARPALDEVDPMASPYFSLILVPGQRWRG